MISPQDYASLLSPQRVIRFFFLGASTRLQRRLFWTDFLYARCMAVFSQHAGFFFNWGKPVRRSSSVSTSLFVFSEIEGPFPRFLPPHENIPGFSPSLYRQSFFHNRPRAFPKFFPPERPRPCAFFITGSEISLPPQGCVFSRVAGSFPPELYPAPKPTSGFLFHRLPSRPQKKFVPPASLSSFPPPMGCPSLLRLTLQLKGLLEIFLSAVVQVG